MSRGAVFTAFLSGLLCLSGLANDHLSAANAPFRVSLSVSPFAELLLKSGIVYTDGKTKATTVEELQRMFVAHGATEVYARVATLRETTPGFGDHSLNRGLMRARLAKSLGLPFNPEIGLFKAYGDVRCQPPPDFREYGELKVPGPWMSLTIEQMLPILRAYGALVAKAILDTGVRVNVWDLGNEVDFGVAGVSPQPMPGGCDDSEGKVNWYKPPDQVDAEIGKTSVIELLKLSETDRIAWLQTHVWRHEGRIFAAAADGIRSVDPNAKFSTHVSGILAVRPKEAVAFFTSMKEGGYLPDQLGFSFYPSSTPNPPDRLEAFKQTILAVNLELNRPVFIAEFAYPSAEKAAMEGPFAYWNHALQGYPLTPAGQAAILRDLTEWGIAHSVSGIRPWAPDTAIAGWSSFALFEAKGKVATARPGLDAIEEGLRSSKAVDRIGPPVHAEAEAN